MRNTMRVRNRWFSVVAMTCLSGFALCGCTSGSRDLSSSLSETAGREAIEAERHVAERKQQQASGAKSKELLASKSRNETPNRVQSASKTEEKSSKPPVKSAELASQTSEKSAEGRARLEDTDLATADWAGDYLDRRVQTVSGDEEEVVETAEPLLDRSRSQPAAAELFDEDEATVKVPKSLAREERAGERPGRASIDGASEHPWSQKAPTTVRSTAAKQPSTSRIPVGSESVEAPADPVSRMTSTPKSNSRTVKQTAPDDARQAEAKARVDTLLTQSKSLLNKGEHRSAFRVAQLAQRIADSENLFFAAGEEQPADLVRLVLLKIRSDQKQVASTGAETHGSSSRTSQLASRTTGAKFHPGLPLTNQADEWSYAEWQNEQPEQTPLAKATKETNSAEPSNNPWAVTTNQSPAQPVMRISPGSSSRGSSFNEQFPKWRPEWRGAANEPQTLTYADEETSPGLAHAKEGRLASDKVVQAKLSPSTTAYGLAAENSSSSEDAFAPGPFPAKTLARESNQMFPKREREISEPLAVVEDWRTQDLNDVATSRQPLLVAPLPPAEPLIPSVLTDPRDDIFAVEVQEPLPTQPQSKLWMILAAAAGAFAMLFVRRRPAHVVRSSGEVR